MPLTASKPGTGWRIPDPEEEKEEEIAADVSEDSEQSESADAAVNAAANGDWAKVRALLESGACDPDEADAQGETAVAWAVRWGELEQVIWLAQVAKADIDESSEQGLTPVVTAALAGRWAMVEKLVQLGADVHAEDADTGATLLLMAARAQQWPLVRYLLDRTDADVDDVDRHGNTALTLAAQHESWETVAYLVGKGADTDEGPEVEAPDGSGPRRVACIVAAAWRGLWDVVVSLVNAGVDVSTTDPYGRTPAVLAAQAGCWDAVRRLVAECRSDPDDADEQGCSLLMMAARSGLAEMVEMLIQHEATVDETDDEGLTALAYAASYGQVEAAKALMAHGAEVDDITNDGRTPLMLACKANQVATAMLLHGEGDAGLNEVDDMGWTALMHAAEAGHLETVRWLLGKKARVLITNRSHSTAYAIACKFVPGHPVVTLLKGKEDAANARKSKRATAKVKAAGKKGAAAAAVKGSLAPQLLEVGVSDEEENTDDEL